MTSGWLALLFSCTCQLNSLLAGSETECASVPSWFFPWGAGHGDLIEDSNGQTFVENVPYSAFGVMFANGLRVYRGLSAKIGRFSIEPYDVISGGPSEGLVIDLAFAVYPDTTEDTQTAMRSSTASSDLTHMSSFINAHVPGTYNAAYVFVITFVCLGKDSLFSTFQGVFTTDGCQTFVIFNYHILHEYADSTVGQILDAVNYKHYVGDNVAAQSNTGQVGQWIVDVTPEIISFDAPQSIEKCLDCECAVPLYQRVKHNTGKKISKADCEGVGGCWEKKRGFPFCYSPTGVSHGQDGECDDRDTINARGLDVRDCGWKGISDDMCMCLGCCCDRGEFGKIWCYHPCVENTVHVTAKDHSYLNGKYTKLDGQDCSGLPTFKNTDDEQYLSYDEDFNDYGFVGSSSQICSTGAASVYSSKGNTELPWERSWNTDVRFAC